MGDHLAELTSRYYDFAAITSILVPKHEVFKIARDKALTLKYAWKAGTGARNLQSPRSGGYRIKSQIPNNYKTEN